MKVERHSIQYGENRIAFAIVRRERTTLEIAVEPDASVVVAAPQNAPLRQSKRRCASVLPGSGVSSDISPNSCRALRIASMWQARIISISADSIG